MTFIVNDNCIGCGLCAATCPEVFSMKDDGFAEAIDGQVEESLCESAEQAMHECPVDAIEQE